jgi:hypothetical protein
VLCTKKCLDKYQHEKTAKPGWHSDGKDGPDDNVNSLSILLDWLMTPGNYSLRWRGKCKDGKSKSQVGKEIADLINDSGIRVKRTSQQVVCKIQHIERQFKSAHDFATSETGAGLEVNDKGSFADKLRQKCPFYDELLEHFDDRASATAKATSDDNLDSEFDSTDYDDEENDDSTQKGVEVIDVPGSESKQTPAKKRKTSVSSISRSSKKKERGVSVNLMDENTANSFASLADAKERVADAQRIKLQNDANLSAADLQMRRLSNKLEMISQCEKFIANHPGWTKDKILCLVPDFKEVIDDLMDG